MMGLSVTLATAGVAALINLWLALRILRIRFGQRIIHGDGDDPVLAQRMRAHANFAEYAPIVLILIAAIEWTAGTSWWLALAGGLFIAGRIAHPFGMAGWLPARQLGTGITLAVTALLSIAAITLPFVQKPVMATDGPFVPNIYRG
ncbi:MAPEG family protein [Sphingomonas sp.]|uniref:MAPEG family protein n=1 Tax=Sphingomonas sp. TaxID=28214 RepID=UPI002CEFEBEA|nr:MAPEG family protein [Sphingomonas sp.]HTG39142.1 MAPEG family protein [Sphingomonas sp.]